MNDLEVWYSAYLAVLAGGRDNKTAETMADIAWNDYQRAQMRIERGGE